MLSTALRYLCLSCCLIGSTVPLQAATEAPADDKPLSVEEQRKLYRATMGQVRKGRSLASQNLPAAFKDYPLYPYLELNDITNRFSQLPFDAIDRFLDTHDNSYLADRLRAKWLASLARKKRWQDYLNYYRAESVSRTHQCWHLEALHQTGATDMALVSTTELWMDASSLPHACDAPFRRWLASGMRSEPLIWQRLLLALEHGNYRLGRYLSTQLSGEYKSQGKRLLQVHRHPAKLSKLEPSIIANPKAGDVLAYGVTRLARRDAERATQLWHRYRDEGLLSPSASAEVRHQIARQIIAGSPGQQSLAWLVRNDPNAEDDYLLEWRIRLALKQNLWAAVENWIALLPEEAAATPRWRYWRARAVARYDREAAEAVYKTLASERHFYGFLAADQLGAAYGFNDRPIMLSEITDALAQVQQHPAVRRTRELLDLNKELAARREWFHTMDVLPAKQLPIAAQVAHNWGWHPQAIRSAIKAQHWDDLNLRFPLAYREQVLDSARDRQIPAHWIYGIARQESAFAADARSHMGAVGLLQMLPSTARDVARSLGQRVQLSDLLQPETNIALGSTYLSQLLNQFGGNRIIATAAYNAGPHRISRVLARQQAPLAHDVWIETLPYYETRDYVQNVLSFSLIYAYRMGESGQLVAEGETLIPPAEQQLSQSSS